MADRPKRETAPPGKLKEFITIFSNYFIPTKAAASRSHSISEHIEGSGTDSQPENLNSSHQLMLREELTPPPALATECLQFRSLLDEQKEMNRESRTEIRELEKFKDSGDR